MPRRRPDLPLYEADEKKEAYQKGFEAGQTQARKDFERILKQKEKSWEELEKLIIKHYQNGRKNKRKNIRCSCNI